jgi:transposase-like protein
VRAAVKALVQAVLEAEMTEAIGDAEDWRSEPRLSHRSSYCSRSSQSFLRRQSRFEVKFSYMS